MFYLYNLASTLLSSYVDFLNIMAYDFHGKWESKTGHCAPLFAASYESDWRKQLAVVSQFTFYRFDPFPLLSCN